MPSPERFVYLASASPRRKELLERLGIPSRPLLADDDEDVEALEVALDRESPKSYVRRVTRRKAVAAVARLARRALEPGPILVGDTTVALRGRVFGKPADADDVHRMLGLLSGRTHEVHTAIAVTDGVRLLEALSTSRVRMRRLDAREIDAYVASGEPFGKAGAYAIQGRGASFVARIAGSHSGIVGLPLYETAELLRGFGFEV